MLNRGVVGELWCDTAGIAVHRSGTLCGHGPPHLTLQPSLQEDGLHSETQGRHEAPNGVGEGWSARFLAATLLAVSRLGPAHAD